MTEEELKIYMREYRQTHKKEIADKKKKYRATKQGHDVDIRAHKKQYEKARHATALKKSAMKSG